MWSYVSSEKVSDRNGLGLIVWIQRNAYFHYLFAWDIVIFRDIIIRVGSYITPDVVPFAEGYHRNSEQRR
jgi:hypothetical protein